MKMVRQYIAAVFIVATVPLIATPQSRQIAGSCTGGLLPKTQSALQRRPYDVLRYDLILDWRRALSDSSADARPYHARQTITLRCDTTELSTIELDAHPSLSIEAITMTQQRDGIIRRPSTIRIGDQLTLLLRTPLRQGDTAIVTIDYRNLSDPSDRDGLYGGYNRYWQDQQGNLLSSPLAYTMSQPNSARRWMPCNDRPYDKAFATITVLAPPGFVTLANGHADSVTIEWNGQQIWALRYTSNEPISTYLMVAVASKYATMERFYRSRDSNRVIPLRLYLWQTDSLDYADNAAWMLTATADMMRAYEQYYLPYPFSSYGQALLYPYFMGAMEHQTMTTHHRNALIQRWETVIAHELAHHWLGNLVTCATWNDLWLNEGGATYSERLWIEYAYGDSAARRYFAARRDRDYLRTDGGRSQPPVYNTTGTNLFNTGTTYVKAGWVYHMMRTMLGDEAFFTLLRRYFEHFAFSALETEDFRAFCEQVIPHPPVPWRTFFDQWVYSVGHPILHADLLSIAACDSSTYCVKVRIAQLQDSSVFLPVYVVPLPLRVHQYWSSAPYDTTVLITEREQVIELKVPFLPRSLELDPEDAILCEKDSTRLVLSVERLEAVESVRVMPNPVHRGETITVWCGDIAERTRIRLWSPDGRLISDLQAGSNLVSVNTATLSSGVYLLEVGQRSRHRCIPVIIIP